MKKLILLFCFLLVSSQSFSQIFVENFNYSAGTLLTNTGNWTAISAPGTNAITVAAPGLIFPLYIGSGIGNDVPLTTSGEDDESTITPLQISGSVYASFMINVSAAQAAGNYFFSLATSGNAHDARVYIRSSGAGFNVGLTKANEVTVSYSVNVYSFGTTYLFVDKYTFNPGLGNDQASLFVFDPSSPPPSTEPPVPVVGPVSSGQADAINISSVILRQGDADNSPTVVIDGIYIDNTWNNTVLPVELASFTSIVNGRDVTLNWTTSSERNNSGFEIERSSANSSWTMMGNLAGNGTTSLTSDYSFTDRGLSTGNYNYRLKQIDFNGNFEYFDLSNEIGIGVPSKYDLSQNYPNPFNPTTKISYDLPVDGKVSLKLFDMAGSEIATLVNDVQSAGYYTINYNASSLSSGVYFYTITSNNFVSTRKMMLVK